MLYVSIWLVFVYILLYSLTCTSLVLIFDFTFSSEGLRSKFCKELLPKRFDWKRVQAKSKELGWEDERYPRFYFANSKKRDDDVRRLVNVLKKANHHTEHFVGSSGVFGNHKSFINSFQQQCTVKFRYSDSLETHKKFLKYYMVQKNKDDVIEKPVLFGNVTTEEYLKNIRIKKIPTNKKTKNGKPIFKKESRNYRWILSPEEQLDDDALKKLAENFVSRLGQMAGHNLMWQAAIHRNTSHPHVHILINSVDMQGKTVKGFSPYVVKTFAREASQEILTNLCGERSPELRRMAREGRVTKERWTEFDQFIKDWKHETDEPGYCGYMNLMNDGEIKGRLDYLTKIGLASYRNKRYYIKDDFEEKLKTYSRYNTFRDAERYIPKGADLKMYKAEMGEITGNIMHVYSMNDEDVWNNGIVMQDEKTGGYYFVPSYNPVNKCEGERVTVSQQKADGGRKKDKTIIEYAEKDKQKKESSQQDIDKSIFDMEM